MEWWKGYPEIRTIRIYTVSSRAGIQSFKIIHKLHKLTRIKTGYKDKRPTQKQAPDPETDHTRLSTVSSRPASRDPVFLKPKNKHQTPKQARPTTPIRAHLRLLSAKICVNHLTRDPVHWGGKIRLPQRPEVSSNTGNSVASAERISAAQYTAALKLHEL